MGIVERTRRGIRATQERMRELPSEREPAATPRPTTTPEPPAPEKQPEVPTVTPTPAFEFKFWEPPKAPTSPLGGERVDLPALQTAAFKGEPLPAPEFDPVQAVANEVSQFVEWHESLFDNVTGLPPDPIAGASELLDESPTTPLTGRQGEILDASLNMFWTYKNLEEYLRQYTEYDPDTVKDLSKQGTDSSRIHAGTLNPTKAFWDALEAIHEEHPDTYTAYLGTDAGRAELFSNALSRMFSIPTGEWSILSPGAGAGESIEKNMPDIPILKDSIINTVEIAGDPVFIAATVAFPPAGAAKVAFGAAMASGMGIGEEVAEEVGAPGIVGALGGGITGPTALGFTRAAMRASLRKSRHAPVRGEPMTEILVESGEIPTVATLKQKLGLGELEKLPQRTLKEVEKGDDIVYSAHYADEAEAVLRGQTREGLVWSSRSPGGVMNVGEADAAILAFRVRSGAKPKFESAPGRPEAQAWKSEDLIPVSRMSITEVFSEDVIASAKPIARTPLELKEGVPATAGGMDGPSLEGFRGAIAAHIERPEARDLLRFTAGKVADTVPLGIGRRVQEIVNRLGVADVPELKAAFGWQFQKAGDDATRFMAMAKPRGTKLPFIENEIGQVWVPKVPGKGGRTPGNLFRKGEGEWIGASDVFESVIRGESKYLKNLTAEQVAFIKEADSILKPFIQFAEQATGQKIAKRDAWFPRMATDPETKTWRVGGGVGKKPSSLMSRQFEVQQEAIEQFGIKYKPGVLNVMEETIQSFQRMTRDALMGKYMKEEGILRFGKPKFGAGETFATDISPSLRGVVSKAHAREINTIIGPATRNPVITVPENINKIARMTLTGTMDAGWGSLQLATLPFTDAGPAAWANAMARGFYNAAIEPKQFYRFMARSKSAQRRAAYGGDMGFSSEMMEAARVGGPGLPRIPKVSPIIDVATFPARAFINRLMVGFDASLAYGRHFAFEAMSEVASKPGLLLKAQGVKPLAGKAFHEEMFRLSRFTDTLIGQPKLGGVISAPQHQIESAFMWFATRYTRSFLGTLSYMIGRGYTPAQARIIMSKMLIGGIAINSGLIAAKGAATGQSQEEVLKEIETALNPLSGKKFMSMKIGKDWYGLGGVYRSGFAAIAGMADKENWEFESWEESLYDNPIVAMWRSRTTPITSTLVDFLEGEDFLGYSVNFWDFVDHPEQAGDYAIDKFAPISADALLQDGSVQRKTQRFAAEFFGLRTSPETAWEALEPVMNQVSLYKFGVPYEGLEDNLPAQDFIRNHPNVVAVTEGDVRPIREREKEKFWREYREGRDAIRVPHVTTREDIEESYTSGRMRGDEYREQYGDSQTAEYFELLGFRQGLDIDFDSGDEDEPPSGSVDAALSAYYEIDLDDYRDKDTRKPDWEAFFADRDAALAQVPEEFEELVEQWLHRRETEVRRHMRSRFEEVIESSGYFRVRESVAVQLELSLDDLESKLVQQLQTEDKRATPADVSRMVDGILNMGLDMVIGEDAPNVSQLRQVMREVDPKLDAELFRQGFVDTVRSVGAQEYLKDRMQRFPDMGYFEAPLAEDVKDRLEEE